MAAVLPYMLNLRFPANKCSTKRTGWHGETTRELAKPYR